MAFQTPETYPATASFPTGSSFPASASFPSAYGPDADSYFAITGVTDPTEKLNISQFITGMKKNQWWTRLVWGGTFRSTQAIGSGTTIHSINGAASATAQNAITWGTTGINLTADDSRILGGTGLTPIQSEWTMLLITSASRPSGDGYYAKYDRAGWYNNISPTNAGLVDINSSTITTPAYMTVSSTDFKMLAATARPYPTSSVVFTSVNAGAQITGTRTFVVNGNDAFIIAGGSAAGSEKTVTGIYASHFFFNFAMSSSDISTWYTLYKATIGQGLSLP